MCAYREKPHINCARKRPLFREWTGRLLFIFLVFPTTSNAEPWNCLGFLKNSFFSHSPQRIVQLGFSGAEIYSLRSRYKGEEIGGPEVEQRTHFKGKVTYLNAKESLKYRLQIIDGRFFDDQAQPLCPVKYCEGIVVIDEQGQIFFSLTSEKGHFHHSSLVAGRPVLFAGDATFENGFLKVIDSQSGHYHPETRVFEPLIKALHQAGIDDYMVGIPFADPRNPHLLHEHFYFHVSEVAKLFQLAPEQMRRTHLFVEDEIKSLENLLKH